MSWARRGFICYGCNPLLYNLLFPLSGLVHANMITTLRSLPTLQDADTAYPCYLGCPVLQRMVKNYEGVVSDGQQLKTGPGGIQTRVESGQLRSLYCRARMSGSGLESRGHFRYVIGVRER